METARRGEARGMEREKGKETEGGENNTEGEEGDTEWRIWKEKQEGGEREGR